MYSVSWSLQEDSLLVTQAPVYDAHSELWFKVLPRADASYVEVDIVVHDEVCQESFNSNDLHLTVHGLSDLSEQVLSMFNREDGLLVRIYSDSYIQLVTEVDSTSDNIKMAWRRWIKGASVNGLSKFVVIKGSGEAHQT